MMKIYLKETDPSNWKDFESGIVRLEEQYPEALRSDADDFRDKISRPGSVALALVDEDVVAGFAIGCVLSDEELADYEISGHWTDGSIYLESITISPEYQGRGLGSVLMKGFVDETRSKGFRRICGHFRQNGSAALMRKAGGKEIFTARDWQGTGEDYIFFVLCL